MAADPLLTVPEAVDDVAMAILDEGRSPALHRQTMARHRREWPTLWVALDALLAAHKRATR